MNNGLLNFENNRWQTKDQTMEFRHRAALGLVTEGPVLDLGCGDGLFLKLLQNKGFIAEGIDISSKAIEKCQKQGLKAQILDFTSQALLYSDQNFKTVVLLDVLEHTYQPELILQEAARVSSKNIVFSIPNFNSLPARLQVLIGRVPENNRPKKAHVYWFNYAVIKKILKQNNLKIITIKTHTFWQNKFLIKYLMKFLLKIWPSLFALSFVIKAQKYEP
ncbi:MAG TPA: methionine biosynthesis protein MetW [bacterium]|nr:methionine biosynthesis protein MetW [bacterium]